MVRNMTTYLLTFLAIAIMDVCYAYWARRAAQGAALEASAWATVLIVLNGLAMVNIVNDLWNIVAAAFGAFIGTYVAIRLDHKKGRSKDVS